MRKPFVAGNWKMNKLAGDAVSLVRALKPLVQGVDGVDVGVCPPYTALHAVGEELRGSNIVLGGQNCYKEESGAYTGEISPQMLKDVGCTWVIVGHSERRQHFNETDELLNEKLRFALESELNVIFCIGETLDERESGKMQDVLTRQVTAGFSTLDEQSFQHMVVAYEPVWAIGTGKTATPGQADEAHDFVRGLVRDQFGGNVAENLRIQYGGSVKPDNAAELLSQENVDGALVGGASLDAESFAAIVKAAG